jgi:hypothetical protein
MLLIHNDKKAYIDCLGRSSVTGSTLLSMVNGENKLMKKTPSENTD